MVIQNKILSFKIKRQAKNVFLSDVERTVGKYDIQNQQAVIWKGVCKHLLSAQVYRLLCIFVIYMWLGTLLSVYVSYTS